MRISKRDRLIKADYTVNPETGELEEIMSIENKYYVGFKIDYKHPHKDGQEVWYAFVYDGADYNYGGVTEEQNEVFKGLMDTSYVWRDKNDEDVAEIFEEIDKNYINNKLKALNLKLLNWGSNDKEIELTIVSIELLI